MNPWKEVCPCVCLHMPVMHSNAFTVYVLWQNVTFKWDGMDVLVVSLWAMNFDVGPTVEECLGHFEVSLFKLISGVPTRLTFRLLPTDSANQSAEDSSPALGEVEIEVYYTHIEVLPRRRPSLRKQMSA